MKPEEAPSLPTSAAAPVAVPPSGASSGETRRAPGLGLGIALGVGFRG